jgi:hypothetical protein
MVTTTNEADSGTAVAEPAGDERLLADLRCGLPQRDERDEVVQQLAVVQQADFETGDRLADVLAVESGGRWNGGYRRVNGFEASFNEILEPFSIDACAGVREIATSLAKCP